MMLYGKRRKKEARVALLVRMLAIAGLTMGCSDSVTPEPLLLKVLAGNGQVGQVGTSLADSLVVYVMGLDSLPRAAVPVEWVVLQGGGAIEPLIGASDRQGRATARWRLGSQLGQQSVRAAASREVVQFDAWADPPPPEDWSEVIEIRPAAEIDGETLQAGIRLYNHWQGLLRLTTQTGCFGRSEYPALYGRSGERVAIAKAYGCTYAVTTRRVSPGDSLGFGWSLNVASVAPGDYTLLFKFAVFEINDAPDTLPNVETPVSLGG